MKLDKKKISKRYKSGEKLRIAVVVSNFNKSVTDKLLKGAKLAL
jgi:6,7-dimethyl-8-ribityllumazine synthase